MNFMIKLAVLVLLFLLIAFVLTLRNKNSKNAMSYMIINCTGSRLEAVASYLVHYTPL